MYVVDTSIVSYHQRGHPRVSQRIASTSIELLYTSIVTVEEQLRGRLAVLALNSRTPDRLIPAYIDLEQTLDYFRAWQVASFTDENYRIFLHLRQQGVRIGTQDLRISASAISRGYILVTSNVSDFSRVPGLVVEDWTV